MATYWRSASAGSQDQAASANARAKPAACMAATRQERAIQEVSARYPASSGANRRAAGKWLKRTAANAAAPSSHLARDPSREQAPNPYSESAISGKAVNSSMAERT